MATTTTEPHYKLSAEAAVFVPNQEPIASGQGTLPNYVYNCYPFVKETNPRHNATSTAHQNQAHSKAGVSRDQGVSKRRTMYPPSQVGPFPGGLPTSYCPQHPHRGNIYGQVGYHIGPASFFPHRCPSPSSVIAPYPNIGLYQPVPTSHSSLIVPPTSIQSSPLMPFANANHLQTSNSNSTSSYRKHATSNRNSRKGKVSVGIQNDPQPRRSGQNKCNNTAKPTTRTIILMHAAAQTDFSSEIADHTLEQKPNSLYQGKRRNRRKTLSTRQSQVDRHDSTDSEELDHSDSGYSSPLHRKNQTSSGTDSHVRSCDGQEFDTNTTSSGSIAGEVVHTQTTHTSFSLPPKDTSAPYRVMAARKTNELGALIPQSTMSYAAVASTKTSTVSASLPAKTQAQKSSISSNPHGNGATISDPEGQTEDQQAGRQKTKRKRSRRRRRKKGATDDAANQDMPSAQINGTEDDYTSPILSQEAQIDILAPENVVDNFPTFAEAGLYDDSAECKLSGKRKKRREQANRAAMEEQLEIDLEQQALKVVNQTPGIIKPPVPPAVANVKKSKQLVTMNLMDLVKPSSTNQAVPDVIPTIPTASSLKINPCPLKTALNPLDSSAPLVKRGKEREMPKAKKPSALKKVILKEREERKRLRYIGEGPMEIISTPDSSLPFTSEPEDNEDDNVVISDMEDPGSLGDCDFSTPQTQDLSPVSQNSPISVGLLSPPTTTSNPASEAASPTVVSDIIHKIHSRRFREYCNQVLDKEIDNVCTSLLQTLVKFQDRLYHKDPIKAKSKRRIVLGLREVTKHLKLHKVKLVIISPNLEKVQSKGGLDDALNLITNLCREQDVPFVFALGRRSLGRACAKLVPVSVVGIFNYQGAEQMYNQLMELTAQARTAYHEMVDALAKEVAEYGGILQGSSGLYFSHLGHSRTPSGCSAVSYSSSILSEPFPDQKSDHHAKIAPSSTDSVSMNPIGSTCSSVSESRAPLQDDIYDIDEGNEADTEDNDSNNLQALTDTKNKDETKSTHKVMSDDNGEVDSANGVEGDYHNNNIADEEKWSDEKTDVVETLSNDVSQLNIKNKLASSSEHEVKSNCDSYVEMKSQASSRTIENPDLNSNPSSVDEMVEDERMSDHFASSSSSSRLDRIKSWVRDIDPSTTQPSKISYDDVEFNATLSACEANTDALITRSRSSSLSKPSSKSS